MKKSNISKENLRNCPSYSDEKILNFAIENDMLNLSDVQKQMRKKEREQLLEQHPYKIYQGSDGRWCTYVLNELTNTRKSIKKADLKALEDFLVKYYGEQDKTRKFERISLKELYPLWLERKKKRGKAETYIERIDRDWKKFYQNSSIIHIPIRDLDEDQLEDWIYETIHAHDLTAKQYYNMSIILRQIFEYAKKERIISNNIFKMIHVDVDFREIDEPDPETQIFYDHELNALIDLAWNDFYTNDRLKHKLAPLAILFQFQTGIRVGELLAVRYEDICSNGDEIYIRRMFCYEKNCIKNKTKTKSGKRKIPLTDAAKLLIEKAREKQKELGVSSNNYIFSVTDEPLTYHSIRITYQRYCKILNTINKSSHKARKTFISRLIDGQVNIKTVKNLAGHANVSTTYKSYCFDTRTKEEQKNLINSIMPQIDLPTVQKSLSTS